MGEKINDIRPKFLIGENVLWLGSGSGLPKSGKVKWIGRLLEIGPNLAVGLELDEPLPYGGIDGTWGTRKLFRCESKHGLIVPSSSVIAKPQHKARIFPEVNAQLRRSHNEVSLNRNKVVKNELLKKDEKHLSPLLPRSTGKAKPQIKTETNTLPLKLKSSRNQTNLQIGSLTFNRNGHNISGRIMHQELRRSDDHLERTSSINSSRSAGSRRDRSSKIFSFFKWFKKDRSLDSDDLDSPPFPGSPILSRGNNSICGSIDTLFSTATANSFAFVPPSYYKPFGSATQPEIRIALGPETNTYKNRIRERDRLKRFEKNISLIEKYKLYASSTLPRSVDRINEIIDIQPLDSESKNSSARKKKRKAPPPPLTQSEICLSDAQDKENTPFRQHRRALSEPEAVKYFKACHVKGKRRAPPPPINERTLSLTRKKRPAPPPPNVNPKKERDANSPVLVEIPFGAANFEIEETSSNASTADIGEVISTDTLRLERGVLKPNKNERPMSEPKFSPTSPVSPRPWYKRNTTHKQEPVIWKLDKKKPIKKESNECKFLESGFPRKLHFVEGSKFVNIFSKVDKPEDKRKSQISILTNISELDREAAEIVRNNKAKEREFLNAENNSFYPDIRKTLNQNDMPDMVHRVILDEAEIKIIDNSGVSEPENKIVKVTIEELDEFDAERNSKAQAMYEENKLHRHQSPSISVIPEMSESSVKSSSPTSSVTSSGTYESTTSKPEMKNFGGQMVWVCPRCTLENCRWKITCEACDLWRPSPCEFKERSKNEQNLKIIEPNGNNLNTPSTSKSNVEFLDNTSKLVQNISKGLNISKLMDKNRDDVTNSTYFNTPNFNHIDKQMEEIRSARLAFFDKYSKITEKKKQTETTEAKAKNLTMNYNVQKDIEKNKDVTESIEECRQIINNIKATQEKKDSIILNTNSKITNTNAYETTTKNESENSKDSVFKIVESEKQKDSKITNSVNDFTKKTEQNKSCVLADPYLSQPCSSKDLRYNFGAHSETPKKDANCLTTLNSFDSEISRESNLKYTSSPVISSLAKNKETFSTNDTEPLNVEKKNKESLDEKLSEASKPSQSTASQKPIESNDNMKNVKITQTPDKLKNVSQDIEESRRMLKEMLKEMKHSLPKRPEMKKHTKTPFIKKEEKPNKSDVAEAYLIESETIVEEIKIKKPSEKVSSSAQTSALVRQILPKTKPPSNNQIVIPITVEDHQIKDGVLYTSVSKQAKKIGSGMFELLRPRDFANIEAVKKNKDIPPLYANVKSEEASNSSKLPENNEIEVEKLSEQLTQPQGVADFKAELGNEVNNMNTMAVNRQLKRLESAIANGRLELASILAKELAQMKVSCSVTRQNHEPGTKYIFVELYIEDKHNHRGPFPLKINPKMTLIELKKQVEVEYDLPANVQRWILGKNLANDDSATLESMGVDAPKIPLFLYLVVPDQPNETTVSNNLGNKIEKDEAKVVTLKIEIEQRPVEKVIPVRLLDEPNQDNEIEEIENPDVEIEEPETPIEEEVKQFPFGTLALGWKCKNCTLINRPTRLNCIACDSGKPAQYKVPVEYQVTEEEKKENYQKLVNLDKDDLIISLEEFDCPICLVRYEPNDGVILRECLHVFCRGCLANTVEYSEEAEVKCPYRDDMYTCDSTLLEREIKALVTPQVYDNHLAKSIKLAENKMGNTFHCKTPDCKGWCIYEDNVNLFKCPVCTHVNCLTCQAVHEGLNCKQYQGQVNIDSETNIESKRTKEMLQEMVDRGEAMNCPTCQVVLMKKWGCDWLRCSMCKTEICWITRGPRWGPNGKGDTSGGCQCGVNGIKCHPKCTYCH